MYTYKCTYYFEEGGNVYEKFFVAESEGEAGEKFDAWSDGLDDWAQLIKLEEVVVA